MSSTGPRKLFKEMTTATSGVLARFPCAQKPFRFEPLRVCVFITAVRGGGGGEWRTCAMRDDEPRPVPRWMSSKVVNDRGCVDGLVPGLIFSKFTTRGVVFHFHFVW